ncbi:hypothetical protein JCM6882_002798 [Rhodosporidiobolus microsporus]
MSAAALEQPQLDQQQPEHQHPAATLHTSPTGQHYIASPPPSLSPSNPHRPARLPLDKVQTGEGVTRTSQEDRTLWFEAQHAGFKVECEIKVEEVGEPVKRELVLRDSVKSVQSVVVEVDQSADSPSALIVLTLAPSANSSSPRYYHFHLALSHPSYSPLNVEQLKHILRGWQQSSNGSLKAVIAPQLALSPSSPRPPQKPENYNPNDSTTWVPPFPVQLPPAPPPAPAPTSAPADSSALTSVADGYEDAPGEADVDAVGEADPAVAAAGTSPTTSKGKRRASLSPSAPFKAGSPEAIEDALLLQNAATGDDLFWNDTGRARRRSTLKVRSYAPGVLGAEGGEAPMELDGNAAGAERARKPHSLSKPSFSAYPSLPAPSSSASALASSKRPLDADFPSTSSSKRPRRTPSASAGSPAPLLSSSGRPSRGAPQQQQQTPTAIPFGALPPLPSAAATATGAASSAARSAALPRPGAGPASTPSTSTALPHAHPSYGSPTTPLPASAAPGSTPASQAPTPLSVYTQLHDLYTYVAQLAPMVTEGRGEIRRLEKEGREREREVRELRREVRALRRGVSGEGGGSVKSEELVGGEAVAGAAAAAENGAAQVEQPDGDEEEAVPAVVDGGDAVAEQNGAGL